MTPTAYAVLAGLIFLPSVAMALPSCVGADIGTALPKATEVQWQTVDVPAAGFSGIWQQGQLDGFAYRIFPDLTAIVFNERANAGWRIDVRCSQAAPCRQAFVGSVPDGAKAAAKTIGECLNPKDQAPRTPVSARVGPTLKAPKTTLPPPAKATTPTPAAVAANSNKAAPSQSDPTNKATRTGKEAASSDGNRSQATVPSQLSSDAATSNKGSKPARICAAPSRNDAGSAIRAIQRLLISIGADPGPMDGVRGKRTVQALQATVGTDVAKLDPVSILIVLTAMICAGSPKTE